MTMAHDNGGPAYPVASDGAQVLEHGMTLRDYFAGQALAGDMANGCEGIFHDDVDQKNLLSRASLMYRMADAMIAERNKGGSHD